MSIIQSIKSMIKSEEDHREASLLAEEKNSVKFSELYQKTGEQINSVLSELESIKGIRIKRNSSQKYEVFYKGALRFVATPSLSEVFWNTDPSYKLEKNWHPYLKIELPDGVCQFKPSIKEFEEAVAQIMLPCLKGVI